MKKFLKVLVLFLLCVNLFTLISCKSKKNVENDFCKTVSNLKSYKLEGKLESFFPSGVKECDVVVYYMHPSFYRVEIKNASNNEPQIMIKNSEGIYVLLPTINKIFKINSSWPNNSSYPYILQSLTKDMISDENLKVTKTKKLATLEFSAKMFDNALCTKQKVLFDLKKKLPTEIQVFDDAGELITKFTFSNIEKNKKIDEKLFKVNQTMTQERLTFIENPYVFDRTVTYPTFYPEDAKVVSENIKGTDANKMVIMKYGGKTPFTIVEEYVDATIDVKTEFVDGTIYTLGGAISFLANGTLKFYDGGMEYILASTSLDYHTLVKMAESLRGTADK